MKLNNTADEFVPQSGAGKKTAPLAANPKADSSISGTRMRRGRDEMNLAEFPLTGLTSRREKGKDTKSEREDGENMLIERNCKDHRQRQQVGDRQPTSVSTPKGRNKQKHPEARCVVCYNIYTFQRLDLLQLF